MIYLLVGLLALASTVAVVAIIHVAELIKKLEDRR